MDDMELYRVVGAMSNIAYEAAHSENISEELKGLLMEFWRQFDHYGAYARNNK